MNASASTNALAISTKMDVAIAVKEIVRSKISVFYLLWYLLLTCMFHSCIRHQRQARKMRRTSLAISAREEMFAR